MTATSRTAQQGNPNNPKRLVNLADNAARLRLPPSIAARLAGKTFTEEDRDTRGDVEAELRERRIAAWRNRIPPTLRDATLDGLDPAVLQQVLAWEGSGLNNVLFYSAATGSGKTYAAYALLNRAITSGRYVRAVKEADLAELFHPVGGDPARVASLLNVDMLLIDDVADFQPDPNLLAAINGFVETRGDYGRRTIFTTNWLVNELGKPRPRLFSRIASAGVSIQFPDVDRRINPDAARTALQRGGAR